MHFNLAHIVPHKNLHGLHGYKEIIDTVQWGLQQLGHTAGYSLNGISGNATNILFGIQALDPELLLKLPPETIVYNLEQGRNWSPENLVPQIKIAAERFRIWDYTEANREVWNSLGARNVRIVPVGFAPILQRIAKPALQDIDVLMYGKPGGDRLGAFYHLCESGLTAVFLCGLYGQARDDLIARSKLIVNVNLYDRSKIFEVVRVSYLLANRKAVVAELDAETFIDEDIRAAICCTAGAELVNQCMQLAGDDAARGALENAGFEAMRRRDIRDILARALQQ